jgi:FKBP-type peptidyl-prolyl cis-trans isomerase
MHLNAQKEAKLKKTETGLEYAILRHDNKDRKIAPNDFVFLYLSYALERNGQDSLIFESANAAPDGRMVLQITEPQYKGSIIEGLSMLSEKDSARFVTSADSFFLKTVRVKTLPPFVMSGEKVYFNVGVSEVLSESEMEEKKKEMQAQYESEMKTLTEKQIVDIKQYMSDLGHEAELNEDGIFIVSTQAGQGEMPKQGATVFVHYTGKLLNGNVFDSSVERGQPFSFKLGTGQVIKGWDVGIAKLKPGEKAILGIPSSLAYGARSMGAIPANSPLIFEVELISYE